MLMKQSPQSKGGQIMAIRQREDALKRYYRSPRYCQNCGEMIRVGDNQRVGEVKKKRFCNRSCAAKFNRNRLDSGRIPPTGKCELCQVKIEFKRQKVGGYRRRKYCGRCYSVVKAKQMGADLYIAERTKGEVFQNSKNWQCARSMIRRHAYRAYFASGGEHKCLVCGYDKFVEVAHRKSVSDFNDDALISEINDIRNLVALCRNCHWEFHNGLLVIDNFVINKNAG
jgi:hypothetical protein